MNIDVDRLRRDLMNYFGTAMEGGLPTAIFDLAKVESASDEEIVSIAQANGFNLYKYEI